MDSKPTDPLKQALLLTLVSVGIMAGGWLVKVLSIIDVERLFAWSIATAFTLLFAIFNSLMSIQAEKAAAYWGRSMYAYLGMALANGLAAWAFTGVALNDAESYRWIYVVVTIGFLVFLSMVNFMKRIVNFAEREEWNQPKLRPPKKR